MFKYIYFLSLLSFLIQPELIYSNESNNQDQENNQSVEFIDTCLQKIKEKKEQLKQHAIDMKNNAAHCLKKNTDRKTVDEMSQEIMDQIKKEAMYDKVMSANPEALFDWLLLQGAWAHLKYYSVPKHTIKSAYNHHNSDKKINCRGWITIMQATNQELNDEYTKQKKS